MVDQRATIFVRLYFSLSIFLCMGCISNGPSASCVILPFIYVACTLSIIEGSFLHFCHGIILTLTLTLALSSLSFPTSPPAAAGHPDPTSPASDTRSATALPPPSRDWSDWSRRYSFPKLHSALL
jgi:hypothetical protein